MEPSLLERASGANIYLERQSMKDGFTVIDTDSHVLEPPNLWKEYIDPRYRDRAPYIFTDAEGHDCLHLEQDSGSRATGDTVFEKGVGHLGAFGAAWGNGPLEIPYLNCRAGYEPEARIKHMDNEGIDAAVLYPGIGLVLGGLPDPDFAAACYRAYNRWLANFASFCPERLLPAAMIPLQSVEHAIRERDDHRQPRGQSVHLHVDLPPW